MKNVLLTVLFGSNSNSYTISTQSGVCVCIYIYTLVLHNTGKPCFMPGIHSWKVLRKSISRKLNTTFPFKECISKGLGEWQPHPIQCMTIPLVNIWTCRVHMYCIHTIHTFLYNIHIYIYIYIYIIYLFIYS